MTQEKLLFAVHIGQVSGRKAGLLMQDHCLPIACSHASWDGLSKHVSESGLHALWESCMNVEEFFGHLGLSSIENPKDKRPSGLYVYEVEYSDADEEMAIDEDSWEHLCGGDLRRPDINELEPLTKGQAPWEGVVL